MIKKLGIYLLSAVLLTQVCFQNLIYIKTFAEEDTAAAVFETETETESIEAAETETEAIETETGEIETIKTETEAIETEADTIEAETEVIRTIEKKTEITDATGTETIDANETASETDMSEGSHMGLSEEELSGMAAWMEAANHALSEITAQYEVMALVYLTDSYEIKSLPAHDSETVVTVYSGQQVQIQSFYIDESMNIWEYVTLEYLGNAYSGYIEGAYLACSDERFLAWELEYGTDPALYQPMTMAAEAGGYADVKQFPESYQAALNALKQAHPNWTFVKMNTNLDWDTVIENEMVPGRSLVPSSFPEYMWSEKFSSGWAYATEETLEYYMDPRNWLNETYIFQFEQLTYNATYHTEAALENFLKNTFMSGIIPDTVLTYAHAIWAIGAEQNVSPFHMACRIYQEQGNGTSPLISGTYPGYEGYYNYYNIGASGSTDKEVIESGLAYAKAQNWFNGYYSILGGTKIIAQNYISKGQDTVYLQKFDVDNTANGLYWHQYMQNICAPSSEGSNIKKLYAAADSLENTFVFKIPVYNNMPAQACAKPTVSYVITLPTSDGCDMEHIYLDGVAYTGTKTGSSYTVTAPDASVKNAVVYEYDSNGIVVGMRVYEVSHDGKKYTAKELTEFKDLLTYHGFSIRITGKSGIRFKTGIDETLKKRLINGGVDGYTLKEYGTLVMTENNLSSYPLTLDSAKAKKGISYGTENGVLVDRKFESVNNRCRFTSVLIGLPIAQYKTSFAFRGYIILEKDGKEMVIYGPIVARSIYNLAKQALSTNMYKEGTPAYEFLNNLIKDADALEES